MDSQEMLVNAHKLTSFIGELGRIPKVLIVDDCPQDVELLTSELSHFRCEVSVASNGQDALDQINGSKFDVVFLDMVLPKVGGDEILTQAAGLKTETHFIVATGFPDSQVMSRALKHGAKMVLEKPIRRDTLALFFKANPP